MKVELSEHDIDLLIEALRARAGRHESEVRFNMHRRGHVDASHEQKAKWMRQLAARLDRVEFA